MPDDDLHFSRSGTSHFGKLTAEVKTRLSEDEKADLMRASHLVGMSEWERKVSACSKRGFSTFFHKAEKGAALRPAAEFSRAKIEAIVEWSRTTRGGKQFDLLAVEPASLDACASAYGLCE